MRRLTVGLAAVFLFSLATNGILLATLPLYMKEKGLTVLETGIVFAFFPLIFQALRVFFGAVSDKFGAKKLIFISGLLQAVTSAVYFFSPGAVFYALGKAGEGVYSSMLRGCERRLVFIESPDFRIGRLTGFYYAALWCGMGIGALAAGYLIATGYHWAFAAVAACGMLTASLGFFLGREEGESKEPLMDALLGIRNVRKKLKVITGLLFFDGLSSSFAGSFVIVLLLREIFSLSPQAIGFFLFATYFVQGVAGFFLGGLADRFDCKKLYMASSLGMAVLLLASGSAALLQANPWIFLASVIAWKFFDVLEGACMNKMVVLNSSKASLGRDMNFSLSGYWVGVTAGYALAGAWISFAGFPAALFLSGALHIVFALLLFLLL